MKRDKLLAIVLPVTAVIPLLIVTYFIGPAAIWLWAGIGLGMAIFSVLQRRRPEAK